MDIETDLRRWAVWARESLGLGIKPLAMLDDGKRGKVRYFPMSDDEGLAFDPAVATLKQVDKELYNLVRLHYLEGLNSRAVAMAAGTSKTAVLEGLNQAKTFIAGFICGRDFTAARIILERDLKA